MKEVFSLDDSPNSKLSHPFCATRDDPAPPFCLDGLSKGQKKRICQEEYRGNWLYLVFYSSDFSFV
ncbi:alkyl hydroperoxide reductase [Alicyclobacillaceae bacterium I2511]|nr:alkyl hydroperoxide reductase [Alicyclobacillaceae bacterium I2511]